MWSHSTAGATAAPTAPGGHGYDERAFAADAVAVSSDGDRARKIVGCSLGAQRALLLAAEQPERIEAAVFIGPRFLGGGEMLPERTVYDFRHRARHG